MGYSMLTNRKKKAAANTLLSGKIDFNTKSVKGIQERYCVITKESVQQEDAYVPNVRASM